MPPIVAVVSAEDAVKKAACGHVVLDARGHRQRGLRFLRGAARVPWTDTRTGGARSGRLADPAELARVFSQAGVSWGHPVLVVGAGRAGWGEGARVAWTLAWLDHPSVSWCPLSGEWPRWPRLSTPDSPVDWPGTVRKGLRPPADWGPGPVCRVLDVREADEFAGARRYGEARGGHVPGAVSLPLPELWAAWSAGALPDRLARAGVGENDPVVTICTGGVRSAAAALLIADGGHQGEVLHDERGMWAWSADPSRPMATVD